MVVEFGRRLVAIGSASLLHISLCLWLLDSTLLSLSLSLIPSQLASTCLDSWLRQLNYVAVLITIRAAADASPHGRLTTLSQPPLPLSLSLYPYHHHYLCLHQVPLHQSASMLPHGCCCCCCPRLLFATCARPRPTLFGGICRRERARNFHTRLSLPSRVVQVFTKRNSR